MGTTVVANGAGGWYGGNSGEGSGGSGAIVWIVVALVVLSVIASVVVAVLGATTYKCAWGFAEDGDPDCATGTPLVTLDPTPGNGSGGFKNRTVDIDEAKNTDAMCSAKNKQMDPNYDGTDSTLGKDIPGALTADGVTFSTGCGWCAAPYAKDGECYTDDTHETKGATRRRVWVDDKWQWCDWDTGAGGWKDTDLTGGLCVKTPAQASARRARVAGRGRSMGRTKRKVAGAARARMGRTRTRTRAGARRVTRKKQRSRRT